MQCFREIRFPSLVIIIVSSALILGACKRRNIGPFQSQPLTASMNVSVASGPAPLTVNFQDTSSGGWGLIHQEWYFGDSNQLAGSSNVFHTYETPGIYHAVLRVTWGSSLTFVSESEPVVITVGAPAPLMVSPPIRWRYAVTIDDDEAAASLQTWRLVASEHERDGEHFVLESEEGRRVHAPIDFSERLSRRQPFACWDDPESGAFHQLLPSATVVVPAGRFECFHIESTDSDGSLRTQFIHPEYWLVLEEVIDQSGVTVRRALIELPF